jgi:ABC-type transport system involved in multi-copper enzyme maturation permease subunit
MFAVALLQRSFARVTGIAAGMALLLVGLQVLLVLVARSQEESQSFETIAKLAPGFVQRQFGSAMPAFLSFSGLVSFVYFDPVVILMFAIFAAFIATELAGDIEGGQVDLLLARALSRHWLVTRSVLVVIVSPAALVGVLVLAGLAALAMFAPPGARWPRSSTTASLAAHLMAITWCFGAVGLAASAFARRRMTALGIAAMSAVALYLLEFLGNAWTAAERFAIVSPFHYFRGADVIAGNANAPRDVAVLLSASLLGTAIAYWRFNTRDL